MNCEHRKRWPYAGRAKGERAAAASLPASVARSLLVLLALCLATSGALSERRAVGASERARMDADGGNMSTNGPDFAQTVINGAADKLGLSEEARTLSASTMRSPHDEQPAGGELAPVQQREAPEDDGDAPISASEILQNPLGSGAHWSASAGNSRHAVDAQSGRAEEQPHGHADDNHWQAHKTNQRWNESAASPEAAEQQEQSSRLLLQVLVSGLLTLVSSSLAIVYAIKYCVCRGRRKRRQHQGRHQRRHHHDRCAARALLRGCRAVVADGAALQLDPEHQQHRQLLFGQQQCLLGQAEVDAAAAAAFGVDPAGAQAVSAARLLLAAECALASAANGAPRASLPASGLVPLVGLAQEPALGCLGAAGAHLGPRAGPQAPAVWATGASGCPACPAVARVGGSFGSAPDAHAEHAPAAPAALPPLPAHHQRQPPPAYADLFGCSPGASSSSSSSNASPQFGRHHCQPAGDSLRHSERRNNRQLTTRHSPRASGGELLESEARQPARLHSEQSRLPPLPAHPRPSSASTSGVQSSPSSSEGDTRWQRHEANLLVRLNLNKTKLLSAAELMLLSKLIDVPIVIGRQESSEEPVQLEQDQLQEDSSLDAGLELAPGETSLAELAHSGAFQDQTGVPNDHLPLGAAAKADSSSTNEPTESDE